jgi:hypothetical protein
MDVACPALVFKALHLELPIEKVSKMQLRSVLVFLAIACLAAASASAEGLRLRTNQSMIEDLAAPSSVDIKNPDAVFAAVFEALPAEVTVYPTESYYYFTFPHNGVSYEGNIRFDAADQFDGKIHFAYFPEYMPWREPQSPVYKKMGAADGVNVEKVSTFVYRVTFKGKTITFTLPDLSNEKPPQTMVLPDEVYLAPTWDEAGVKFYLLYNKTAKTFIYILNNDKPMDQYEPSTFSSAVTIGNRTGFAFYKDEKAGGRQILIGVFSLNYQMNTYFDGPFDQIGDNYLKGNTFKDIISELDPSMKDTTDRYGSTPNGEVRYEVRPYMLYDAPEDMKPIAECAAREQDPAEYYACFNVAAK